MCDRREYGLLSKRSKQILGEEVQVKDDAQSADAGEYTIFSYALAALHGS